MMGVILPFEKAVYLGDGGRFWKLSLEEWEQVCRLGLSGQPSDLSGFRPLRGRPSWLSLLPQGEGYYRTRKDRLYYEPRDWSAADFQEALDELKSLREKPKE